jgi:UDP-3-O-[3-hydroxymyristoyl] glucosamine N-acyltransferase
MEFEEVIASAKKGDLYLTHQGMGENRVESFRSVNDTCAGSLAYLNDTSQLTTDASLLKGIVLLNARFAQPDFMGALTCDVVVSTDAKYLYALIYKIMQKSAPVVLQEVSPKSHAKRGVSSNARIGGLVVLGEGIEIGDGVVIEGRCIIGNGTRIKPNTVIGSRGFGYAVRSGFPPLEMPHVGGVRIGECVDLGANCSVDQGTFSPTLIENFVKIDNGVHIAHNVRIGTRTLIAAHAEISGSVQIGDDVWIGPNASLRDRIKIGNGALIGIGSVVTKDVNEKTVWMVRQPKFIYDL